MRSRSEIIGDGHAPGRARAEIAEVHAHRDHRAFRVVLIAVIEVAGSPKPRGTSVAPHLGQHVATAHDGHSAISSTHAARRTGYCDADNDAATGIRGISDVRGPRARRDGSA